MAKKRKQRRISKDDVDANSRSDGSSDECENRRGRTILKMVGKAIKNETKIPLQWSRNKLPAGDNRDRFANYIGVVVRERVSINYREWDDVPEDVINEVYHFITKGFEVPDEHRGYVLRKAGVQWRTFKARLRRDWMYDSKGENKNQIIKKPPSIYSWITQDQWDKFIEAATDPKFKELSNLNRERAKKRFSRYRGGRKGYLYYEEELAKELRRQKVPPKDVPRYLVWIRAHSRQEGDKTYFDNPADFEVAQAIGVDSLCSLAIESGTWVRIVAVGEVYVPNEGEVVKHHCKPIPSGFYRVCIREEIDPNALLPCPEGEIKFICQGKGNFFIWPGHLILPIQKENEQFRMEFNSTHPRSPSTQTSCTRKYTITPADKLKVNTRLVQVFKDVAIGMKKNGKTKYFTIPSRVFQTEQCVSLDYEDMLDWCFQRKIGSSHISILMM